MGWCLSRMLSGMSILSSLTSGFAMYAHGDATVTYQAVMATLTQVMRVVQVALAVALFLLVVRAFWVFIKRATTLPCSHGFADLTECLDCSHPDWFEEVERERLAPAPVVEPVKVSHEPLAFNDLYALIEGEVARMGYADRVTGNGFTCFSTANRSELYLHESGTPSIFTPNISTHWVVYVSAWNGFRKAFEIGDFPEVAIRQAITELIRTYARVVADEAFAQAFVPNCPTCGTQYDTYEYNERNEPCSFGWCPNGKCSSHEVEL